MEEFEYEKHLKKLNYIKLYLYQEEENNNFIEKKILFWEEENNILLPKDYKNFSIRFNGTSSKISEAKNGTHSNYGFSLGKDYSGKDYFFEMSEILNAPIGNAEDDTGNKNWLSFAETFLDFPLYMSIDKKDYGNIYLLMETRGHFDPEYDTFVEVPANFDWGNVSSDDYSIKYHLVAKSFTEFILMLEDRDSLE